MFDGVVVAVGFVLDADGFEDGVVVGPGGVGNPDGLCVQLAFGELGGNTQRACAAEALGGFGTAAGDDFVVCAKEEDLGLLVVVGNAVDGEVVFGGFALEQAFFGFFDGFDDGGRAGCVFINADAEVDFFGTGFGFECFAQA